MDFDGFDDYDGDGDSEFDPSSPLGIIGAQVFFDDDDEPVRRRIVYRPRKPGYLVRLWRWLRT